VCKIAADGSLLAEYDLGTSILPPSILGIATDGVYIWLVTGASGTGIAKIRCSDGVFVNPDGSDGTLESATFDVVNRTTFPNPYYMGILRAPDPTNAQDLLWVTSYTQVSAMQVLPGGINGLVTNYTASAGGANTGYNLFAIAYDGVNAWATDYEGSFVSWVDPYNAELLAGEATLAENIPVYTGDEKAAQMSFLISSAPTCPPTLDYVNDSKNQPPLSIFGI
jgi:hypothetical protein